MLEKIKYCHVIVSKKVAKNIKADENNLIFSEPI
jgi:hypothetical protein